MLEKTWKGKAIRPTTEQENSACKEDNALTKTYNKKTLKVKTCKLYNKKYIIASTQITNQANSWNPKFLGYFKST